MGLPTDLYPTCWGPNFELLMVTQLPGETSRLDVEVSLWEWEKQNAGTACAWRMEVYCFEWEKWSNYQKWKKCIVLADTSSNDQMQQAATLHKLRENGQSVPQNKPGILQQISINYGQQIMVVQVSFNEIMSTKIMILQPGIMVIACHHSQIRVQLHYNCDAWWWSLAIALSCSILCQPVHHQWLYNSFFEHRWQLAALPPHSRRLLRHWWPQTGFPLWCNWIDAVIQRGGRPPQLRSMVHSAHHSRCDQWLMVAIAACQTQPLLMRFQHIKILFIRTLKTL